MSIRITLALHLCLLTLPLATGTPKLMGWVLCLSNGGDVNATAALVLPRWALTGVTCAEWNVKIETYYVTGSKSSRSGVKNAQKIDEMFVVLELTDPFPFGYPTIPIATRTDAYISPKCWTYVKQRKVSAHPTSMIPIIDCRGYSKEGKEVCGVSVENHCYPPCGTAMTCQGRLVGIRMDNMECTLNKVLKFASVAYYDYRILEGPLGQNEGYMEDFPANTPLRKVVAGSSSVAALRIYLILPVSLLIYCGV